jgi:hypothetical protein
MSSAATVMESYTYPGVESPFAHQKTTAKNLVLKPRHQVWNEIGTGKTFSAAWAIDYLLRLGAIKHILLVGPVSTLEVVWQRTLFRVNSDVNITVLKGSADRKKAGISRIGVPECGPTISIINPESLHIIADHPACDNLDLIVIDESAMFRNSKSRRYGALCKLVGNFYEQRDGTLYGKPIKRRVLIKPRSERNWKRGFWPMTGSPSPEQPTDVWAISALASPDRVPLHFSHFRDQTMVRVDQFTWVPRPDAEKIIADMLRGTVTRFTRDECFDLPPTQYYTHELEMTDEQKDLVKKLRRDSLAEVEQGLIKGPNQAVVINKFLQIFSGAVKVVSEDQVESIHKVDCGPKLTALDELLESSRGPVIVAADFAGSIARLAEHAERNKIPYRVVVGGTSKDDRRNAFDDLQADKYKMLIAHPRTIAHGLTLTTSNVILWWTPIYSHEIYEQFCGRITRPGQERKTYIVHFTCSALERMVLAKVNKKKERQNLLLKYLEGKDD